MSTQTVVVANSTVDFLAAFPRLVGVTAPESIFIVGFEKNRTIGSARIDLPIDITNIDNLAAWISCILKLAAQFESVATVITTNTELGDNTEVAFAGKLAGLVKVALSSNSINVKDIAVIAADGWAAFMEGSAPTVRSLDEIRHNPHYVDTQNPTLEDWRRDHPTQTHEFTDDLAIPDFQGA